MTTNPIFYHFHSHSHFFVTKQVGSIPAVQWRHIVNAEFLPSNWALFFFSILLHLVLNTCGNDHFAKAGSLLIKSLVLAGEIKLKLVVVDTVVVAKHGGVDDL